MKKLSDRGYASIILMIVLIIGVAGIILINHVQDVQSQQWQKEIGIKVEVDNE